MYTHALFIDGVPVLFEGCDDGDAWRRHVPAMVGHLESLGDRVVWHAELDEPCTLPLAGHMLIRSLALHDEHCAPFIPETCR